MADPRPAGLKVLFVCTGNTCRSVLAEQLLKKLSKDRGLDWQVRSCGTAADPGLAVPGTVRKLVKEFGTKTFHHSPRPLSPELVRWADLVLAMTDTHMRQVWTSYPEAKPKTHLLRELAGLGPDDIDDPIGGDEAQYRQCLAAIRESLERILDAKLKESHVRPS